MRKGIITCFFLVLATAAWAQFPTEVWHEGTIVLLEGDTLKGLVKYDLETDLVQYSKAKRTIKTYTARKLLHFEIFDSTSGRYRSFYVLPYNLKGNYKAPIIFELIYEGKKLSLLSREAVEYEVSNYPYSVAGTYSRLELVYTHFFLTDDGRIIKFEGKRNDLLHGVMNKRSMEVKKFIKSNHLRVERRPDLVKVVAYYNSLFEEASKK